MNAKFLHVKYLAIFLMGIVILLLVSFDAFSQSEVDMGAGDTFSLKASQDILKEVVSYEPYEATCSREVYDGTHRVCSAGRTERRCRKISGVGEECWDETEEVCSDEPSYRTETYDCILQRRVVDYVYDYSVNASIEVIKTLRSKNYDLNSCLFGVKLSAGAEDYYARCKSAVVKAFVVDRKEVLNGRNKERTIKLDLDFFPIEGLSALTEGLKDLTYKDGVVSFKSANLAAASNFKLNVKLTRNRLLLKDKVIFNREISPSEFTATALSGGKYLVALNLGKLSGGFDSTKKHTLKVDLSTLKALDVKDAINTPTLSNALSESLVIND
ncbi:hypothetical protein DOM21_09160 [Bacteriovorax stolpii]|uniref:hypothetical protein n=1 Tax=Bacteriovorax stolpii TaxID=960 RepID=UPI00115A94F5|nr:hypothetical protein [Bacteriovorax stolpii]QDK41617.1 hypothetical protein DOM21_09160 [Bacteriovorax stolpii]